MNSVRFEIEQGQPNIEYIQALANTLYELGYLGSPVFKTRS